MDKINKLKWIAKSHPDRVIRNAAALAIEMGSNKVICDSIGSCHLCDGCGAAVPHDRESCEPCPVVKEARCIPVNQ